MKTMIYICFRGGRYEDKRLPAPWDDAAWKTWKAEKPLTPWGTIPVLDYQGLVIGQSTAASRLTRTENEKLQETRHRVLTFFFKGSLPKSLVLRGRIMLSRLKLTRSSMSSWI